MISYVDRFLEIVHERGLSAALRSVQRYVGHRLELRRLHDVMYEPLFEWQHGAGLYVIEEDWDNLVLLDACRYDYFEQYTDFDGELSRVVSRGNDSWGFIEENFVGRELHDTVYVTANPHSERLAQDVFYTVETVLDRWDEETGTVLPEDVTERAIEVQEQYPDKRLIVHYMQPHEPHLGNTARKYDEDVGLGGFDIFYDDEGLERKKEGTSMFVLYRHNRISRDELEDSYRETLDFVEKQVKELVGELEGKTVISADHGENLGEVHHGLARFGHSNETIECRYVPWLELPFDTRKTTRAEPPIGFEYMEEKYVEERLEDLGYL